MFAPSSLEFYLNYKVNIAIQELFSTNSIFSRTLNFYFNIEGLSRCVRTLYIRHIGMYCLMGKVFRINSGF